MTAQNDRDQAQKILDLIRREYLDKFEEHLKNPLDAEGIQTAAEILEDAADSVKWFSFTLFDCVEGHGMTYTTRLDEAYANMQVRIANKAKNRAAAKAKAARRQTA